MPPFVLPTPPAAPTAPGPGLLLPGGQPYVPPSAILGGQPLPAFSMKPMPAPAPSAPMPSAPPPRATMGQIRSLGPNMQGLRANAMTGTPAPSRVNLSSLPSRMAADPNPFPQMGGMRAGGGFPVSNSRGFIAAGQQSAAARGAGGNFAQRGVARYGRPGMTAAKGVMGGMAIGQLGNMGANMMGDNAYGNTASAGATGAGMGYMAAGSAPIAAAAGAGVGLGEVLSRQDAIMDPFNDFREQIGFGRTNDTVIDLFDPNRGTPLGFIGGLLGVKGDDTPQMWDAVAQISGGQVTRAEDVRATLDDLESSGIASTEETDQLVAFYNDLANQRVEAGEYTVTVPAGPPDPTTGESPMQSITITDPEQIRALTWAEANNSARSIAEEVAVAQQQQDMDMGRTLAIQQALSSQLAPYAAQAQSISDAHNAAVAPYISSLPAQYQAPIAATSRSISDLNNMYANASIGAAIMAPQYQQYQQSQEANAAIANQIQQMGVQYQLDQYRNQMYPSQSQAAPTLDDAMMASLTQ